MLPGDNKSCYDREALRRWVKRNPINPMTREPLDDNWITKNLREMDEDEKCVDEDAAISSTTGGRKSRRRRVVSKGSKRSRRAGKIHKKAKHSRKRRQVKGKRTRRNRSKFTK